MKTKLISLLIFFLLIGYCYPSETILSPDGKWIAVKPFIDYYSITIGIEPTDIELHKFKLYHFLNKEFVYQEEFTTNTYRKYIRYRDIKSIYPNLSNLEYIIYVDDKPVVTFEFHTNCSGIVNYSFVTWLK